MLLWRYRLEALMHDEIDPEMMCECGCQLALHGLDHPHICKYDPRAWWPDIMPSGMRLEDNHCDGFNPKGTL